MSNKDSNLLTAIMIELAMTEISGNNDAASEGQTLTLTLDHLLQVRIHQIFTRMKNLVILGVGCERTNKLATQTSLTLLDAALMTLKIHIFTL